MTDIFSRTKRSAIMASVATKATKPELVIRSLLDDMQLKWEANCRDLPGCPDLVLRKKKVAIQVHGCFWHAHRNCPRGKAPQTNKRFWKRKQDQNRKRDAQCSTKLRRAGYAVITIWACETNKTAAIKARITKAIKSASGKANKFPKRNAKKKRFKAIDLFSGCGGLTLGLKRAGFEVVAAVELDRVAATAYAANHAEANLIRADIRRVSGSSILRMLRMKPGDLDLLAGCPPCQGFSTLRNMNGGRRVIDRRNDLIYEFLRFVRVLRPKTVMLENVPGLATTSRFKEFRAALQKLGYSVNYAIKDAAFYGVPQRRRRLILIGSQIGCIPFPRQAKVQRTVRHAIRSMREPGRSGDMLHDLPEVRSRRIQELIKLIPKDGGSRSQLPQRLRLKCHESCNGFKDVYGRMAWDEVAPTITGGCFNPSKGRYLHPVKNRAITLREAALLQTFPRSYKFPVEAGKQQLALLIGNALPPELTRRQGTMIIRRLQQAPPLTTDALNRCKERF